MDPRDRKRIASPTIAEVLDEFLTEQRARLSEGTYRNHEAVIGLFTQVLNRSGPKFLTTSASRLYERLHEAEGEDHREFAEIFGVDNISESLGHFLDHYQVARVRDIDVIRATGTVMGGLARWLGERGHLTGDDLRYAVEAAATAARELPDVGELFLLLEGLSEEATLFAETTDGIYEISRVEGEEIWLDDFYMNEFGPFRLPPDIAARCRPGWTISATIGRRGREWYFAQVDGVSPRM